MIKATTLALLLGSALSVMANAQTADELKNDANTPGDVLVYGMGYSGHRYSPLTLINKENVNKLVPIWSLSMSDNHGGEGFPLDHQSS